MLKVCSAQFSNFLSFKENIQLTNLEPITVLVGPNNAGKSNIIRTYKFYQELLILEKDQKIQ
jgi:AAA15 family ATPase/GTPase